MNGTHFVSSPLGGILLSSDGTHLTGLRFTEQTPDEGKPCSLSIFEQTERWLDCFFSGRAPSFTPPLMIEASPFCRVVYEAILSIPFGQTASYAEIALQLVRSGKRTSCSARAVGAALKRNPILLIVPCHRVIGADGSLTGYAAGIERKRRLLLLESKSEDFKKYDNFS